MITHMISLVMSAVAFTLSISIYLVFKGSPYGKVMLYLSLFFMFMISYHGLEALDIENSVFKLLYEISELIAFVFMLMTAIQLKRTFVS